MMINEDKKLEFRLWPYIKFPDHREYMTEDKNKELEGLYFDFMKHRWMPQDYRYGLKAVDANVDFLRFIEYMEDISRKIFI